MLDSRFLCSFSSFRENGLNFFSVCIQALLLYQFSQEMHFEIFGGLTVNQISTGGNEEP